MIGSGLIAMPIDTAPSWQYVEPNFYTGSMSVAWRVLNWAFKEHDSVLIGMSKWLLPTLSIGPVGNEQYDDMGFLQTVIMPPADAQRLWLNKILELAIEAGIVEEE